MDDDNLYIFFILYLIYEGLKNILNIDYILPKIDQQSQ